MAVLVEGISVVIKADSIIGKYKGGAAAFGAMITGAQTLCSDGELVRVGFMAPADVKAFVERLETQGLTFLHKDSAADFVVVDQQTGLLQPCSWAEYAHATWEGNAKHIIAICRAVPTKVAGVMVPSDWRYETSLTARFRFVPSGDMDKTFKFVGREDGVDVYVDPKTGKKYYVGRSGN